MCYESRMTTSDNEPVAVFTPGEREYIRRELDQFFSFFPSVAEGFALRTWRGGPQKDQPKLPPPAKSLIDFFTTAGMGALRQMMANRRLADPSKFAHVRRELGIDPPPESKAAE
jgi:hypothetical protein